MQENSKRVRFAIDLNNQVSQLQDNTIHGLKSFNLSTYRRLVLNPVVEFMFESHNLDVHKDWLMSCELLRSLFEAYKKAENKGEFEVESFMNNYRKAISLFTEFESDISIEELETKNKSYAGK